MKSNRRQNQGWALRANLPTSGSLHGVITIVQEDRFRLEDAQGRGYLFTLGRKVALSQEDLRNFSQGRTPVTVEFEGAPDLGAVALAIRS